MHLSSLALISRTSHFGSGAIRTGDATPIQFPFELVNWSQFSGMYSFVLSLEGHNVEIREGTLLNCVLHCDEVNSAVAYDGLTVDDTIIVMQPQSDWHGIYAFAVMKHVSQSDAIQMCEYMVVEYEKNNNSCSLSSPTETTNSEYGPTAKRTALKMVSQRNCHGNSAFAVMKHLPQRDAPQTCELDTTQNTSCALLTPTVIRNYEHVTTPKPAALLPVPVPSSRIPVDINILDDDTTCSDLDPRVDLNEVKHALMIHIYDHAARIGELERTVQEMNTKLNKLLVHYTPSVCSVEM